MTKFSLLTVSAVVLGLATPALAQDHGHDDHGDGHTASLGEVTVIHAWTRAAEQGSDAVVFFEVDNHGEPVVLSGAEAENATSVDIVGASMGADGAVAYEPVGTEFTLPSGDFEFDPDGLGVRLVGLTEALNQGDNFHMHLLFADGELEISVDVEAADATQHSHAGHSH